MKNESIYWKSFGITIVDDPLGKLNVQTTYTSCLWARVYGHDRSIANINYKYSVSRVVLLKKDLLFPAESKKTRGWSLII